MRLLKLAHISLLLPLPLHCEPNPTSLVLHPLSVASSTTRNCTSVVDRGEQEEVVIHPVCVNPKSTMRMSREAKRCLFLSRMSGNGQGGEHRLPTEGDTGFHCELQGYREQWSEGWICWICVCVCMLTCLLCTQMQWMALISPVLALLAEMPCGNEVTYKVMTWLHGNTLADIGVKVTHTPDSTPKQWKKINKYLRKLPHYVLLFFNKCMFGCIIIDFHWFTFKTVASAMTSSTY